MRKAYTRMAMENNKAWLNMLRKNIKWIKIDIFIIGILTVIVSFTLVSI